MKLAVRYSAQLIRTMEVTTTMAWSLRNSAVNISLMLEVLDSALELSLNSRQQSTSAPTKQMDTSSATVLKPCRSLLPPNTPTSSMVNMVTMALPTPAQVRPTTERLSRSAGVRVTAGIMDQ